MKQILLSLCGGLIAVCGFAQLNGTYTINGAQSTGGTNFQTFTAAFSALTSNGVNGAVTFNCVQGTYNEQVYLSYASISGTSTTNTITFQAAASNTSEVLWTYSSQPLYLNYCTLNNITFDGLHFETTGGFNACIYMYYGTYTNMTYSNNVIDGAQTTSTSTLYAALCSYFATQTNLEVIDNEINYGSMGVLAYYTNYGYAAASKVTIEGNDITDYSYMGIYAYGQYSSYTEFGISDNTIANNPSGYAYPYAIYCYYPKAGSEISNNHCTLDGPSGGYGLLVNYAQGNSSSPVMVYNNIVNYPDANDPLWQRGIQASYNMYTKIYHNTVSLSNDYTSSYGAYLYYSSTTYVGNEFKNNIISTNGAQTYTLYTYFLGSSSGTMEFDNNSYYGGNGSEIRINNVAAGTYNTLAGWQSASSEDANAVVADPLFVSSTDLTPQSAEVNNLGEPLGISTDINGNSRSTTVPDPGAIEFSVPINNAQPQAFLNPVPPLCTGDSCMSVVIKNTGLVNLTTLTIDWWINTSAQTTINWTGNLVPQGLDTVMVTCALNLSDGDSLSVETSLPNGVVDSATLNDQIYLNMYDGLSGVYSIPNDYTTLSDARNALVLRGVCDHVVFNISPGTYTEQVEFPEIVGAGQDATITFQSSTGNTNDVFVIHAAAGASDNYVVRLDGADWITFKNMSMHATGTGNYANVFNIENGATHVAVDNCWLKSNAYPSTSTGNYRSVVYIYGVNEDISLTDNKIEAGSTSIYAYGSGVTSRIKNLTIENNQIEDHYYYGNYMYYIDGLQFNNNVVTNDSGGYTLYMWAALYMYYVDNFDIKSNYFGSNLNNGYYYTVYGYYCNGRNNPRSQIANNCIYGGAEGSTTYGYYTLYMNQSGIFDVNNNSVTRQGGSAGTYNAAYFGTGGLISVKNNSFANMAGGYAFYAAGAFTLTESDNNNFYSASGAPIYWGTSPYNSLEDFQEASGFDMNSVVTNPNWQSSLSCITCNDTLNGAAQVLSTISDDINGNARSTVNPDIGAVEYVTPSTFTLGPNDTVCASELLVEAGPAQSVTWNVNNQSYTQPSILLAANNEPVTYNVFVNISTEYCGSASDDVIIRLVPDAQLDASAHICADEDLDLQPGGSATATYVWSTGASSPVITVNEAGTYSVVKTEEGCESEAVIAVTQSAAVEIGDVEACSDDMPIELNATIADGTSYAWSAGSSVNTALNTFNDAGSYSVTASDSYGCASTDNFNLIVLEEPQASVAETHSGLTYFFDASGSIYISSSTTYFWDFGYNGLTSNSQMATVSYPWSDPSNPASYNVSLTVNNGCGEDVKTVTITPDVLGVDEKSQGAFSLYPNPASDQVQFNLTAAASENGRIEVLDIAGRTLFVQSIAAGVVSGSIDVSDLVSGSYMIKLDVNGNSYINTLIKN